MMQYTVSNSSVKNRLTDALITLGLKKDYLDISITELCREAGINRSTFYHYYDTKDDLLKELESVYLYGIDKVCSAFLKLDLSGATPRKTCQMIVEKIVTFHLQTKEACLFLLSPGGDPYFKPKLKNIINHYFLYALHKNNIKLPFDEECCLEFISSGIIDALTLWLKNQEVDANEFSMILSDMVMPLLEENYNKG